MLVLIRFRIGIILFIIRILITISPKFEAIPKANNAVLIWIRFDRFRFLVLLGFSYGDRQQFGAHQESRKLIKGRREHFAHGSLLEEYCRLVRVDLVKKKGKDKKTTEFNWIFIKKK